MEHAGDTQYAILMRPVAYKLLGEPTSKAHGGLELRYGSRGSLSIDLRKGAYFDHEVGQGGGVLDLVVRENGGDRRDAIKWLTDNRMMVAPATKGNGLVNETPNGRRDHDRSDAKLNGNAKSPRRIVDTYDYLDEGGQPLRQIVRYEPKEFRQRRPDGRGGWTWNVDGVKQVPYRLPGISKAIASGNLVFVVEGEKDADALWEIGIPATCNAGGAGKWSPELNPYFRNADVVVLPDHDPQSKHPKTGKPQFRPDGRPVVAGWDHAQEIAHHLYGIAAVVRVLLLPDLRPKGDVSDWLAAGGTIDRLHELASKAEPWQRLQPCSWVQARPQTPTSSGSDGSGDAERSKNTWPRIAPAALHGLAGDVVRAIEPETESDPIAILIQYLSFFGNAVGRGPFYQVEGDKHHTILDAVLVGDTSKGRKGTSLGRVRSVFEIAEPEWVSQRLTHGMSSGEGLINEVRDDVKTQAKDRTEVVVAGVEDKRLMIVEPEFAGVLTVMKRQGNKLSDIIRNSWDGKDLRTLVKTNPLRATAPHISIIGHITADELRMSLDRTSMANGYANRFLFVSIRRARLLPHGGNLSEETVKGLALLTQEAVSKARAIKRVIMTNDARTAWEKIYATLSEGQPGLLGAIIGRAEAQTIRLALLYSLLDGKSEIDVVHLKAAAAVWGFCEASARYIFGDLLGDPLADEIMNGLRHAGDQGLTRTDISKLFSGNRGSDQIGRALDMLKNCGKAGSVKERGTGGNAAERWFITGRRP